MREITIQQMEKLLGIRQRKGQSPKPLPRPDAVHKGATVYKWIDKKRAGVVIQIHLKCGIVEVYYVKGAKAVSDVKSPIVE